jgi:hypothetical protein
MSEKDNRLDEQAEFPDRDAVVAKAGNEEPLTLQELHAINEPPKRLSNDEADIGKRYDGTDYAPAAQPDLLAPAYVLVRQATLDAEGNDDTRSGAGATNTTEAEDEAAEAQQERREELAAKDEPTAKKAAAKKS